MNTGEWWSPALKEPVGEFYAFWDVKDYHWGLIARVWYLDGSKAERTATYFDEKREVKREQAEARAREWMEKMLAMWTTKESA